MKKIGGWIKKNWVMAIIFAGIIIIWSLWWMLARRFSANCTEAGQMGDMFGSLNVLFTGLAFWGLVYSIILQRRELEETKKKAEEEIALQKEQLELAKKQSTEMQEQAEMQKFDSGFWQRFRLLGDTIERVRGPDGTTSGRTAIRLFSKGVTIVNCAFKDNPEPHPVLRNQITNYEFLRHYYLMLLFLLRYVDEARIENSVKIEYAKAIRATLSTEEIKLIEYESLSDDKHGFKYYIEKYAFLADYAMRDREKIYFPPSASSDAIAFSPEAIKNWDKPKPDTTPAT
jgi:hypothetical protein